MQVTYQCNIECGHCGPFCGPHEKDWMTLEEMKDLISQASELGANNVVFTGGEPTLLGPKLPLLLRFIRDETSILTTRLVTNGKWAYTRESALEHLTLWRNAGLDELNISCGEYHQEFVPITSVANGYRAGRELGLQTVLLAGEFLKEGYGKFAPQDFADAIGENLMPVNAISPFLDAAHGMQCGQAMRHGRGRHVIPLESVERYPESHHNSRCPDVFTAITAHPNGNMTACCGVMVREESLLNIGNWRQQRLRPMLEAANDDRVLNWIRYVGLKDMRRWLIAKDPTLTLASEHTTICDMCAEIMFDPKCQQLLLEQGHERDADIIANKVAVGAVAGPFVYNPDGSSLPGRA